MTDEVSTYRPCRYCGLIYPACKCQGYKKDRKAASSIIVENWVEGLTIGEMMEEFKRIFQRPDAAVAFSLKISFYNKKKAPVTAAEAKEE